MKVFIVTGEHPHVPGVRRSIHATFASAQKAAIDLTNLICCDLDEPKVATAATWQSIMEECEDRWGAQYTYVTIDEDEVQS